MFLIGWAIYKLTIQWISGRPASTSVLLTFALALVIEGTMGLVWSTTYHAATPAYFSQSFRVGDFYFPKGQVYGCGIAVGVLACLYVMLKATWLGRAIRAVSENLQSARLVGVNARHVAGLTFAIGVATTGAGGSIGSELSRQIARVRPRLLILLDHAEGNLFEIDREMLDAWHFSGVEAVLADCREGDRMLEVMQRFKPEVVFHAAAYKHVPMMEANPLESVRNNVLATKVVAEVAVEFGAQRFVLISTDKALNAQAVTPQGGRTGLSGGALALDGGVALDLTRMNRILEIDRENLFAVVEPGVVTQTLQEMVEGEGLFYPPDPASRGSCTIGGNIAENAGGPRAAKYGTTGRYVSGLRVALPGGSVLSLGGKNRKDVAGYDLVSLFVGSEGTLGVVTQATLRLLPLPSHRRLLWASFAEEERALEAVSRLFSSGREPGAPPRSRRLPSRCSSRPTRMRTSSSRRMGSSRRPSSATSRDSERS